MHCAACVNSVENALKRVQGVATVNVNLVTNRASVVLNGSVSDNDLAHAIQSAGYVAESVYSPNADGDASAMAIRLDASSSQYRSALLIAAPFAVVIMIIAMWAMMSNQQPWVNEVLFVLTLPVLWAGRTFYQGAVRAALHKTATMDTLISIGTGAAFLASVTATFAPSLLFSGMHHSGAYFDSTATIITLVLLGKWLEARAKRGTAEALQSLMELHPKHVRVRRNEVESDVATSNVVVGDIVIIRPNEQVPVDGIVVSGSSSTDESLLTGESLPRIRTIGNRVIGGSQNLDGSLVISATAIGQHSVLAGIIRSVEQAQSSKAPVQRLADRISAVFVPVVLLIAITTFVFWFFTAPPETAFNQALTSAISVLIIACPCALGLATPAAIIVGSGQGARQGVLFSNAEAIERLCSADVIVLDKTGTLTEGAPRVLSMEGAVSNTEVVALALRSTHPASKAIAQMSTEKLQHNVESVLEEPGKGISGMINGRRIRIGSEDFMLSQMLLIPAELRIASNNFANNGWSTVFASVQGTITTAYGIADSLRNTSVDAVAHMKQRGLHVVMITGDSKAPAEFIAAQAGIADVVHSVSPQGKAKAIAKFQRDGSIVIMVGDGVNDAPALAQADVGIAMGGGTDVARSTAGVTLLRADLHSALDAIDVSRRTMRTIRQNLVLAFSYNILGIPLAAGLLIPLTGTAFSPMIAAAAMALSSVSVVTNALRLRITR